MRVRSLNMNDAHIYCTPEQFAAEFNAVNEMYLKYFKIFGIEKYVMRFSTHDPARLTGDNAKFVNEPALWKQTEDMVRQTLIDSKIPYVEVPNEAAFYGPKIDVQVWSVIGREFTLATNQVDFAVPAKFGLVYRDKDNTNKTPLCIHRAPLGTHERFIGFLIEHYAGNFPLWLAPEQVRVMTIGEEEPLVNYAKAIVNEFRPLRIRFLVEQNQRQDSGSGTGEGPHHAGDWRSRHGSRERVGSSARQRQPGRQAKGGSNRGDSGGDQGTSVVIGGNSLRGLAVRCLNGFSSAVLKNRDWRYHVRTHNPIRPRPATAWPGSDRISIKATRTQDRISFIVF
jgi:hypothetical protein